MTQRKNRLLPAVVCAVGIGTAFDAADARPTRLTPADSAEIDEGIEMLRELQPMMEGILDSADPLLSLRGKPAETNDDLIVGLREALDKLEQMHADGRIHLSFTPSGRFPVFQHAGAVAWGSPTRNSDGDDHITFYVRGELRDEPIRRGVFRDPSILLHEASHYVSTLAHVRPLPESIQEASATGDPVVLLEELSQASMEVQRLVDTFGEYILDVRGRTINAEATTVGEAIGLSPDQVAQELAADLWSIEEQQQEYKDAPTAIRDLIEIGIDRQEFEQIIRAGRFHERLNAEGKLIIDQPEHLQEALEHERRVLEREEAERQSIEKQNEKKRERPRGRRRMR